MKSLYLLLFTFCLSSLALAQNKFQINYSQSGNDFNDLNSIKRISDGYIMVGTSGSTTSNLNDLIISKVDLNMNLLWSKTIGTTAFDEKIDYLGKCVVFEPNGIVILATTTLPGTRDFLLTKVDYNGVLIWSKSYTPAISSTSYIDNASALCKTNNGYYLCGYCNTATTGYGLVVKVDSTGTEQWSKYFIPQSGVICNLWAGLNLSTNDLVISGAYGNGATDSYLLKISSSGVILWQKNFTKSNYDNIHDLAEDKDNTLLCAMMVDGYFTSARGGLLNIDLTNGALNWAKNFDLDLNTDRDGQMVGLLKNADQSTMLSFIYTNASAGSFKHDIALVKLDANANLVWSKKYSSPDCDQWPKIFPNNDNYIISAERANNRYPSEKFYLIGLGSDGKSGCNESDLSPVITTLTGFQWVDFNTTFQTLSITETTQFLISNTATIDKTVLCVNTGINEVESKNAAYLVYPNPAGEEIYIYSTNKIMTIEIYNSLGQIVASNKNESSIKISDLKIGTYFIKVNDSFYSKFVKE